jgi:glycosyltransferase involved in cell wall biosynthesis
MSASRAGLAAQPARRVALVVNSLGTGGVERQLLTLARGLDAQRFDVELIALKSDGPQAQQAAALSVKVWSPQARSGFDPRAVTRLASHLRESRFHVVLAANQYATLMLRAAAALAPRPGRLLSAFHSSPSHIGKHWRDRLRLGLYKLALRGFDGLVFVSGQQRNEWHELGLGQRMASAVIHNGIDTDRFCRPSTRNVRAELGWPSGAFVVGLCAALRPEKRVPDLVQAVALARQQGVPAHLLIVGDGPQRVSIEQAITRAGLGRVAHITGLQGDVVPFIQACDVMSLVSSAEAFSMAVLESMACGKPVVLTDVGGAAEQVEQGVHGYRVPVSQPDAVAAHFVTLWRDGAAQRLGDQARERVRQEFSLQRMLDDYARLFEEGVTASAAPSLATVRSSMPQS